MQDGLRRELGTVFRFREGEAAHFLRRREVGVVCVWLQPGGGCGRIEVQRWAVRVQSGGTEQGISGEGWARCCCRLAPNTGHGAVQQQAPTKEITGGRQCQAMCPHAQQYRG